MVIRISLSENKFTTNPHDILDSCYSPVLNNFIRFILTAAHCVIKCKSCNGGKTLIKRNKNGVKTGYLIKAVIGRLKNGDIYGIVKVIQHPDYQEMSSKKVVKYCNKALSSGFPIYGSWHAQVPFFVMN